MTAEPQPKPTAEADPATAARRLLRACDRAALATGMAGEQGWPYPSLVMVGLDYDGSPLLLISDLADHTRNLKSENRVGLLFDATHGLAEPLTGARLSVLGRARPTAAPRHRARYLARHPGAALYAGFRDFAFYRVEVARAHLVAGFGRIHWIAGTDLLLEPDRADRLADCEAGIVEHMNADHADAVALYARVLLGRAGSGWRLAAVDPDGCDLRNGAEIARLDFEAPAFDAQAVRAELVRLARRARDAAPDS